MNGTIHLRKSCFITVYGSIISAIVTARILLTQASLKDTPSLFVQEYRTVADAKLMFPRRLGRAGFSPVFEQSRNWRIDLSH